jgi:Solitary outer membrane autotransporter beta-barrel domain
MVCVAQTIDNREVGSGYAHLVSFQAEPEIAGASFTVDSSSPDTSDTDINAIKLPLYKSFERPDQPWDWYAQGSLSYLEMESSSSLTFEDFLTAGLDQQWKAYGGLLEAGLIYPIGNGFSLASGLGIGISRLENKTDYSSNQGGDFLESLFEGTLYNWDTNASVTRASIDLLYDKRHGKYRVKGSTHLSYSYVDSFGESGKFAGFSDHAGMLTFKLDVRHPLNIDLGEHPLYVIGHLGNTTFIGSNRDQLDFTYYNELGASLGIEKFTLGFLTILGGNVEGLSLVFNYNY